MNPFLTKNSGGNLFRKVRNIVKLCEEPSETNAQIQRVALFFNFRKQREGVGEMSVSANVNKMSG
jgi:hypothetical protein